MSKKINEESILHLFFRDPTERHLRGIARELAINPTTARKYLDSYVAQGLLTSRTERGDLLFRPAEENPMFRLLKRQWTVRTVIESGLVAYLEHELASPTVVLFGSKAKGEDVPGSDLDLFIIAETKRPLRLDAFERRLGCPIQVFLNTRPEFRRLRKTSPELINNVLNGTILAGYVDVSSARRS